MAASRLEVGVAYDVGGRGGGSSSDTAATGLDEAVTDGYDPVIAVGSTYAAAVRSAATAHPTVRFAIVDDDSVVLPNVTLQLVIMTSTLERVDTAVQDYIAAGDLAPLPARFDLGVGGVGYARSGGRIDDIDRYLQAYAVAIAGGAIKVDTIPSS